MKNLKIGDLVVGKRRWWGEYEILDEKFCKEFGVVSGYDEHNPDRYYRVTFPFGTYLLYIDDLVLISQKSAESIPENNQEQEDAQNDWKVGEA